MNALLASWNDLLWEVFEIFSTKPGQQDVAATALELLPFTQSILAKTGEKHYESREKLENCSYAWKRIC
jgi:hypothetical protein